MSSIEMLNEQIYELKEQNNTYKIEIDEKDLKISKLVEGCRDIFIYDQKMKEIEAKLIQMRQQDQEKYNQLLQEKESSVNNIRNELEKYEQ